MKVKKNDFVEIEFTGKIKDTQEVFDTNIKKEAEKISLNIEEKPLVVCIRQEMLVKGFDKSLDGKEIGKKYKINLSSEEAFGKRNPSLIKIIPLNVFKQKDINPVSGLMLNLDGMLAKIITVSGGRVITDFNNPLSGKEIEYEFEIKKKVTDEKEKINSLQDFFFKKRFNLTIKDKKIVFEKDAAPFLKIFEKKFHEILKKDIEIGKKTEGEKTESKTEVSNKKHI